MASQKETAISVEAISTKTIRLALLGTSPIILNRMTAKVRQELLFPALKLKKEERSHRLKHDPIAEFRDSAGRDNNPDGPTEIVMPATAFKGALASAAVDADTEPKGTAAEEAEAEPEAAASAAAG